MKIYLVRHGQSEGNLKNLWYGSSDLPLTELGREQARLAGQKLREVSFAACYASPLSRALDTAKLVMEGRSEPLHIVPDLREQHMGLFEPKSVPEIKAEDPDFYQALMADWVHITPPEGEPFDTGLAPRVAAHRGRRTVLSETGLFFHDRNRPGGHLQSQSRPAAVL